METLVGVDAEPDRFAGRELAPAFHLFPAVQRSGLDRLSPPVDRL
jgi:hypothetical protein